MCEFWYDYIKPKYEKNYVTWIQIALKWIQIALTVNIKTDDV